MKSRHLKKLLKKAQAWGDAPTTIWQPDGKRPPLMTWREIAFLWHINRRIFGLLIHDASLGYRQLKSGIPTHPTK